MAGRLPLQGSWTRVQTLWTAMGVLAMPFVIAAPDAPAARLVQAPLIAALPVLAYRAMRRSWAPAAWRWSLAGVALVAVAATAGRGIPFYVEQATPWTVTRGFAAMTGLASLAIATAILRRQVPRTPGASTVNGWIALATVSLIAFESFIEPLALNPSLSGWTRWSAIATVAICTWLAVEFLRMWLKVGGLATRAMALQSIAIALLMVVVLVQLHVTLVATPEVTASAADAAEAIRRALQVLAIVLLGLAPLDPSVSMRPSIGGEEEDSSPARVVAFSATALAVAFAVQFVHDHENTLFDEPLIYLVWALVILGLVAYRIVLLAVANRGSLRTRRALARATDELVATTTIEQVHQRIPGWIALLTRQPSVAVDVLPIDQDEARRHGDEAAYHHEGRSGPWHASVVVPADEPLLIQVRTPQDPTAEAIAGLTLLARSLGLALDRIALSDAIADTRSLTRVESLLANASDVIALVNPDQQVAYVTLAIERLTGLSQAHVRGMPWPLLAMDPDRERALLLLQEARRSGRSQGELRFPAPGGAVRYVECTVTWVDPDDTFIITHHDVTERHHLQEQLIDQAFHDSLTGLANRALFRDRVSQALARARRTGSSFVVMLIDLDDFKTVNDSLGHPAGDELLRVVSQRLNDCLRGGDTAARLGGDEFAVILENTWSVNDAARIASRILQAMAQPVDLGGNEVVINASVGVAVGDASCEDSDELERNADLALYEAKYSGKGRYTVYEPAMHGDALRRLQMVNDMRRALEGAELVTWFQPIVDLASGAISGVEALVRWQHPDQGLLEPSDFVPLAEETGLIVSMGSWVLSDALGEVARWQQRYPQHRRLRVSVNLSGRQLMQEDIVQVVEDAIARSGISPATVILEITESVFLPGESLSTRRLRELSDLGLSIYIDDFGTGYSSLRYLRQLPVHGLKLAKEFVDGLPDPNEVGLVRAVSDLATTLGLDSIVAEGIERPEQLAALRDLGYTLGQGFLLGEPLQGHELDALLAATPAAPWAHAAPGGQAGGVPVVSSSTIPVPVGPSAGS